MKKSKFNNFPDKRKKHKAHFKSGQLVWMHDIEKTFSKGDSTNCSDKLYTITQVIHELILSYRINRIPERFNKHPLRSTSLTLDGNNQVMKKLIIIRKNRSSRKDLTEDKLYEKHGKQYMHCTRKTLLPYKNELTCNACGYNVMKQKKELTKIQQKNNIDRL